MLSFDFQNIDRRLIKCFKKVIFFFQKSLSGEKKILSLQRFKRNPRDELKQ